MTKLYQELKESPQAGAGRSRLNFAERSEVRSIQVRGTTGLVQTNNPGKFTSVYYLEGDEQEAAQCFVDENYDLLTQIDFSKRNLLQTSLSRDIYDLILDALGYRKMNKYPTVVLETRQDNLQWVISRKRYDTQVDRRYTTSGSGSAQIPSDVSLMEIYTTQDRIISETDLRQTAIDGDVRQVLDYYRVADAFACDPISTEAGELAVQKALAERSETA